MNNRPHFTQFLGIRWIYFKSHFHCENWQSHRRLWFSVFLFHLSEQQWVLEVASLWLNNSRCHLATASCTWEGHLFDGFLSRSKRASFPEPRSKHLLESTLGLPNHCLQHGGWGQATPGVRGAQGSPKVLDLLHKVWYVITNWAPLEKSKGGWLWGQTTVSPHHGKNYLEDKSCPGAQDGLCPIDMFWKHSWAKMAVDVTVTATFRLTS